MTTAELQGFLERITQRRVTLSLMIWGPPGVGKSSVVAQVADKFGLPMVDVRLSQLAPTDLRGLPVAEEGVSRWYPPEFLPRDENSEGVLFLDELNMAPPAMQGVAQQLILDRRVGSYVLPRGWLVWAAGNRREDRASAFEMPAPLANRFLHLEVLPDFDAFKSFALASGVHERVIAFLSFRPALLHKLDAHAPAWPSPRSWTMASRLLQEELPIAPAVGEGASAEFAAYVSLYDALPDFAPILAGRGESIAFPQEPSARYALVVGLTVRARNADEGAHAFRWLVERASAEWVQLFASDLVRVLRSRGELGRLATLLASDARLGRFISDYRALLSE